MLRSFTSATAAAALLATPIVASPAFAAPASSVSIAKAARVGTPTTNANKLGGGSGFLAIVIVAGILAIGVIAIVNDSEEDSPDSP